MSWQKYINAAGDWLDGTCRAFGDYGTGSNRRGYFPNQGKCSIPGNLRRAFERHHSEMGTSMRLELTEHLESVEIYDTVIIIYPNWLSSMPVPVFSFLEEYGFSGKTIIPIATSQALGLGSGPEQIAAACPDAVVADGLSARSRDEVKDFLTKAGLAQ